MAEFQEVMRQYDRMCTAHAGCFNCPLHRPDGVSDRCNIGAFVNNSEYIEREIMKWAAENPEPVYPTWYEYLSDYYRAAFGDMYVIGRQPIPADIAERLGIKPKDVTNDG